MKKDKLIETITDLPQEFELEVLLERLVFIDKVEKGLIQSEKGETKTHDQVKQMIKKW